MFPVFRALFKSEEGQREAFEAMTESQRNDAHEFRNYAFFAICTMLIGSALLASLSAGGPGLTPERITILQSTLLPTLWISGIAVTVLDFRLERNFSRFFNERGEKPLSDTSLPVFGGILPSQGKELC